MKVVTAEQMRTIDRTAAGAGLTTEILMENAGRAVAQETIKLLGNANFSVLILTGPGNNGGDGLVAAKYLKEAGARVTLYLCSQRSTEDKNFRLAQKKQIGTFDIELDSNFAALEANISGSNVIIDSLFGTGRSRTIEGNFKQVITRVNDARQKRPELVVVAVDVPSGLDANTGEIDSGCISADATITLGYPKPGLYNFPGAEKAGKIVIADIGIPPTLAEDISVELLTGDWVKAILPKRPASANKGTFGKLLVVSGSINYIGAAYLACMGAARSGTGLVTLGTTKSLQSILATKLTEVTYLPLPETSSGTISSDSATILQSHLSNYNAMLLGCGLSQNTDIIDLIKAFLFPLSGTHSIPFVLDADALNALAQIPDWWQRLNKDVILTPHPGEMSRLTGLPLNKIQQDRLEIARQASARWQKVVVLKGAYTIIASPDGQSKICQEANPGLASAGTGDVLSGIIAGLAAQGLPVFEAACCGVYIHAQAGNALRKEMGDTGMLASDLLPILPKIIRDIKEGLIN
jgi:ADP-dependent NAD(P)H-hydrate dehydratase / NAD(P)H-hydrate epimerase